jgi:cysteine desulfurase
VAAIVGAAVAFVAAQSEVQTRAVNVEAVRDAGMRHILHAIPDAVVNGPTGHDRVANNINISIPGLDTEYAVVVLDTKGIAASTKSACAGAGGGESAVVRACTHDVARARSTLRLTLGPESTIDDIEAATAVLAELVDMQATLTHR